MSEPIPRHPILLVDDEEQALQSYDLNLRYSGLTNTIRCSDPRKVPDILRGQDVSLVMLDLCMPQMKGEELLAFLKERHPQVPVIIVTGFNEVETAVRCMRAGSVDYLVKPVDRAHLLSAVRHALEVRQAAQDASGQDGPAQPAAPRTEQPDAFSRVITGNARMLELMRYVRAVAPSDEPVLITGETGVGKEMIARAIHDASGLSGKFVGVNVAGLDDAMFSDTLFGHKKGAFTGANLGRRGLVEEAAGGSLFLDEIGDLGRASQLKLLRLIQEREFYPLGSDQTKPMEARLIVATNQPLEEMIERGDFRSDLFFRLRTHYVAIPPLRERLDDLGALVAHFLEKASERLGRRKPALPREALDLLACHAYPGNIRELEAMIFNAVALCDGPSLPLEPLKAWLGSGAGAGGPELFPSVLEERPDTLSCDIPARDGASALKLAQDRMIQEALERAGGNQSAAAKLLGISRQALNRRLLARQRKAAKG